MEAAAAPPLLDPWDRHTSACDAYDTHADFAARDAEAADVDGGDGVGEDVAVDGDGDDDVAADVDVGSQTPSPAVTSLDDRKRLVDTGDRMPDVQRNCSPYVRDGRRMPGRASRTCRALRRAERVATARNWPPPWRLPPDCWWRPTRWRRQTIAPSDQRTPLDCRSVPPSTPRRSL